MPEADLNIAEKVIAPAINHPSAYEECRKTWAEFITAAETGGAADQVDAVTDHVRIVSRHDVPMDERSDVIVAGFWAASAEHVINQRGADVNASEQEIRRSLEAVWQEVA